MTRLFPDTVREQLVKWARERDVRRLALTLFGRRLTPRQIDIARVTALLEHRRATVVAPSQYGKDYGLGTGIAVNTILGRPKKWAIVAPKLDQANLLRAEWLGAMLRSPVGIHAVGLDRNQRERMERELTKRRYDLRTGHVVEFLSGHDDAERLMGHGADVVIATEGDRFTEEAHAKILRMGGRAAESSVLIYSANPWEQKSTFARARASAAYHHVEVTTAQAIAEGRFTQAYIDEMRASMPFLLFQVFYLCRAPDAAENQLIRYSQVDAATKRAPPELAAVAKDKAGAPVAPAVRYGLDVANGGGDLTVLTKALAHHLVDGRLFYEVAWQRKYDFNDTVVTAGNVRADMDVRTAPIRVDAIGVGAGVASDLKHLGARVDAVNVGSAADDAEAYANLKAEMFWQVRTVFEDGRIRILNPRSELVDDLVAYRHEIRGARVATYEEKPSPTRKSPDYGDSLALAIYEPRVRRIRVG